MAVVIFTVTIPNGGSESLLNNEQNKDRFGFQDEVGEVGEDDAESAFSASFYSEHGTPAPDRSKKASDIIIQVTTAYTPQDPERGFVFGRNPARCDILLDHPDISEQQFAMKPQWGYSTMLLINYSAQGTDVKFNQLNEKHRLRKQRVFAPGETAEIRLPCRIEMHIKGFDETRDWKAYCAEITRKFPTLGNFVLDPGPETTDASKRAPVYIHGRRLGKGATAEVFAAVEKYTAMPYAVKVFKKKGRWNEPQILESLKHTNIVRYVAYIRPADQPPQLVMELVDGPDLQRVLSWYNGYPELDVSERRDVLGQLLDAVRYIHRRGVIHRDLKPANILVAERIPLRIKLADFSDATSESFKPGQFVGTPPYTAPEMINGPECTQKVDMFAIGVVALQLLYGLPEALHKLKQRHQYSIPQLKARLESILRWRDSLLASHPSVMLDFVCGLLQEEPRDRHSADKSLRHGFFQAQLDDALVPAAAVPDLATQIYNPNPQRDAEYFGLRRRSAEEAEDIPYTPTEYNDRDRYLDLQSRSPEEAEDMPDTLYLGPDPQDIEVQDARADNILDAAPQAGPVDLRSLSAPTEPQARKRSSRSSLRRHHTGHHEREPSSSGSQRAKRHKGKHATHTRQHDGNNGRTAMELLEEFKRLYPPVRPTGEGDRARPQWVGSRQVPLDQDKGLYVILVNFQKVSMDASDWRVNASQVYKAAVAGKIASKRRFSMSVYYRRLKSLGVISKREGDSQLNWLPFRHGYFLSQALGLESDLAPLFSLADEALPKREENYLIPRKVTEPPGIVYDEFDANPGEDGVGYNDDSEGHGAAQAPMCQDGDRHLSVGLPKSSDPPASANYDNPPAWYWHDPPAWCWHDPPAWYGQPVEYNTDWKSVNFDEVPDPEAIIPRSNDEDSGPGQVSLDQPALPFGAGLDGRDSLNFTPGTEFTRGLADGNPETGPYHYDDPAADQFDQPFGAGLDSLDFVNFDEVPDPEAIIPRSNDEDSGPGQVSLDQPALPFGAGLDGRDSLNFTPGTEFTRGLADGNPETGPCHDDHRRQRL